MKRLLLFLLCVFLLRDIALAEDEADEVFTLTATVTAEQTALTSLPIADAETLLPLSSGDALTITALGTSYCEATAGEISGYIPTADIAFDILQGEPMRLAMVDVSPTNREMGRLTLREGPSTKSKALRKLPRGTLLLLMEEEDRMVHVALPDAEGYIMKGYTDDAAPTEYRIAYVAPGRDAWLRLDSRYSSQTRICLLPSGTPVQFITNPNGWASVEAAGYRARMLAEYLTFEAPENE